MSIIDRGTPTTSAADAAGTVRPAIVPAVVFIIVEILLVAETVWVIVPKDIGPGNPGAAPIAIFLSVALLANLGLVCTIAAATAADSVRRWKHETARELSGWFAVVRAPAEGIDSAGSEIAGVVQVLEPASDAVAAMLASR